MEDSKTIKQTAIDFAEWAAKEGYKYYYNGRFYIWVNDKRYYTTEELYDIWLETIKQ